MKTTTKLLIPVLIIFKCFGLNGQPYFDTHVANKFVKENTYIGSRQDTSTPPRFDEVRDKLPVPLWPARPDVIKLYWRTWELAFGNLRTVTKENGFINPYVDPAFNGNIFTEDCGFMMLYGRYGFRAFDFQKSLDNFYALQHKDGFICREIHGSNGKDAFERFDPSSAGINIFPWAEWEYFCNTNDLERLKRVFPVLIANYQWYSNYRTWPDGSYFSSGWGCGMDNQPRLPKGFNPAFSHGHMSWIDATLQQVAAGKIILRMARVLDRQSDVTDIAREVTTLTAYVNSKMWNSDLDFYVDRFRDGSLSNVKSIGAYWALLSEVIDPDRKNVFLAHLSDPSEFNRPHRIPTLSADNPSYDSTGGYWRGAVWAMTNYMVLRGLTKAGEDSLAFEIAMNDLDNVTGIFNKTGIIWENYSPEFPTGSGRENFVGEGGLTGTAILLEYIFGIRADVPGNTIVWDIRLPDEFGVSHYPFGQNGVVDLLCKKRNDVTDEPEIRIRSNVPFRLKIVWEGGSKTTDIKAGTGQQHL